MSFALGVDVAVAILIVFFCLRGLFRGLSGEFFSLLGTVGGVVLAWRFAPSVATWYLTKWPGNHSIVMILAMVLFFLVAVVASTVLCRIVQAFLRWTALSFVDRILGSIAGALKAIVLVMFLYAILLALSPFFSLQWMEKSISMRVASSAWPYIYSFFEGRSNMEYHMQYITGGEKRPHESS